MPDNTVSIDRGYPPLSNAEIADRLTSLAQLLSAQKENPFKVKAYRRAAKRIRILGSSIDQLVRANADLTQYPGIGKAISGAIREIVETGALRQLESLRAQSTPHAASLTGYPRLDPARVLRIYKKLNISCVAELEEKLKNGEIASKFGARMADHVSQGLTDRHELLLYNAEEVANEAEAFLRNKCGALRAAVSGACRRRVEVIDEISFLIEVDEFRDVVAKLQLYGGKAELLAVRDNSAVVKLASGVRLKVENAVAGKWGLALIVSTGSEQHLRELDLPGSRLQTLARSEQIFPDEASVYGALGLQFIAPELREGRGEVQLAAANKLPILVQTVDIRGELHAHSTASDGAHTIEQMAAAAKKRGYEYLGITDHSKSLKIARGLSEEELWAQIRHIDKLNATGTGVQILKSAEVDILPDGALDYPDELLRQLDYTVCSIHSRFNLGKQRQTERIMRAMDNRYFTILGHATGRLLLKRHGYEVDMERLIDHARNNSCFFEINSSPDRLDVPAEHARFAAAAGVKIAVNTDAHSVRELDFSCYGIDQARRAGLERMSVLNCLSWSEIRKFLRR